MFSTFGVACVYSWYLVRRVFMVPGCTCEFVVPGCTCVFVVPGCTYVFVLPDCMCVFVVPGVGDIYKRYPVVHTVSTEIGLCTVDPFLIAL